MKAPLCTLGRDHGEHTGLLEAFDIDACDGIDMVKPAKARGLSGIKREIFNSRELRDCLQAFGR